MTSITLKTASTLALVSLLSFLSGTNSFTTLTHSSRSALVFSPSGGRSPLSHLYAEDGGKNADVITVKSEKRELALDPDTGKIVDQREEECIPSDEFCVLDEKSGKLMRLTLVEKERIFLDSLQSYYVNGRQLLNDSEFDLLKEDLAWNGSPVAVLNRKEAKYLNAMQAFSRGEAIISDEEFDALKKDLKEEKSRFAVSTEPKCYIDSGICTVTLQEDEFRSNLLYLPVGSILSILWLGIGFEIIEPLVRINPLLLIALGSPVVYLASKFITEEYIFQDNKVAYGPCPSCEVEQRVYFGNILGESGFGDLAEIKCKKCKQTFRVQKDSLRASTLPKN